MNLDHHKEINIFSYESMDPDQPAQHIYAVWLGPTIHYIHSTNFQHWVQEQQRPRPDCAFAQSGLGLCCSYMVLPVNL